MKRISWGDPAPRKNGAGQRTYGWWRPSIILLLKIVVGWGRSGHEVLLISFSFSHTRATKERVFSRIFAKDCVATGAKRKRDKKTEAGVRSVRMTSWLNDRDRARLPLPHHRKTHTTLSQLYGGDLWRWFRRSVLSKALVSAIHLSDSIHTPHLP